MTSTRTVTYSTFLVIASLLVVLDIVAGLSLQAQTHNGPAANRALGLAVPGVGFELPVNYPLTGYNPWAVAVADVNGDGTPDLMVVSWYKTGISESEGSVDVLLGKGDGTFQSPKTYGTLGGQALGLAVGDLNGDNKPDLVITNSCMVLPACDTGGGVTVMLGNGDGTFQPGTIYYSGGQGAQSVAIADMNGDGRPDLIVGNCCHLGGVGPGTVGVLLGNGDGTFQSVVSYDNDTVSRALEVSDLNGDGHADVAVTGDSDPAVVSVLLGNGDGTLQTAIDYPTGAYEPHRLAIGDVNGDNHPDLIVTHYCQGPEDCTNGIVTVFLGKGDGTFQSPVSYSSGGVNALGVAVADVDSDGRPDLVVADNVSFDGTGLIEILLGNGDGTFQASQTFPSGGTQPEAVVAVDLNRDGKPDVAVAHAQTPSVDVLINNSGAAATSTVLVSLPNPSTYGQPVALTATVSASTTPTGTVVFYDGASSLGSQALVGGTATVNVTSFTAGSHTLLAVFQGSAGFAPSSSPPVIQTVNTASTASSLNSSLNPVPVGQTVIYTASVSTQFGATPTGTVTFYDRETKRATVPLSGNLATFATFYKLETTHIISAVYSGDANNKGSTSPSVRETVGNGATHSSQTIVVTSQSPALFGQPVTFTASVTSPDGPIPDGELVAFYDGRPKVQVRMGTATTSAGVAAFTTTSLSAGGHTITANYLGDVSFKSSFGIVHQAVEKYATTMTLTSSQNPSHHGTPVIFTVTVISVGGPVPTGQVFLNSMGYLNLSGGVAQGVMPGWSEIGDKRSEELTGFGIDKSASRKCMCNVQQDEYSPTHLFWL